MNILHMRRVRSGCATREPSRSRSTTRRPAARRTSWTGRRRRRRRGAEPSAPGPGMEAPVLVLRNGSKVVKPGEAEEGGLFPTYREEFEQMWMDSRPVS
ncbi:DUF5919 domain-containing protein [Streptomyces sp. INA 01156]